MRQDLSKRAFLHKKSERTCVPRTGTHARRLQHHELERNRVRTDRNARKQVSASRVGTHSHSYNYGLERRLAAGVFRDEFSDLRVAQADFVEQDISATMFDKSIRHAKIHDFSHARLRILYSLL